MDQIRHKTQPILDATSLEIVALEVLTVGVLPFADKEAMIEIDAAAMKYGAALARKTRLCVHCNLEYTTLMLSPERVVQHIEPGIIIELVERHKHEIFDQPDAVGRIEKEVARIRQYCASIALDDVTPTTMEHALINCLRPDIIKIDHQNALKEVLGIAKHIPIVAERIETRRQAELARAIGAAYIQGYWCDRIVESRSKKSAGQLVDTNIA